MIRIAIMKEHVISLAFIIYVGILLYNYLTRQVQTLLFNLLCGIGLLFAVFGIFIIRNFDHQRTIENLKKKTTI